MASEAMRSLIDLCYEDEEMRYALKDIMGFKRSSTQRFGREEMDILEDAGFEFSNSYITQRKNEVISFLSQHPECCSQDFETMIDKITYFCVKHTELLREKKKKQKQRMKEIAERNKKRSVPTKAEKKADKKQKRRSRASSVFSSQIDEEEEEEESSEGEE